MDYKTQTIGIIYRAKNTKNSKIYIGYTRKSFEFRKHQHEINATSRYDILAALKRNEQTKHFYNAIRLYGLQSFEWSVICEIHCLNHDDINMLKEAEKIFIRYYDSTNVEKGYNKTKGGDGVLHAGSTMEEIFGEEKAREIKKKISDKCRGMKLTPEQKKRWREKINSKEYRKKFLKTMRDPIRRAKVSAGLTGHIKKPSTIEKHKKTMRKKFPITKDITNLIYEEFFVKLKTYGSIAKTLSHKLKRSVSRPIFIDIIYNLAKEKNISIPDKHKQHIEKLKTGEISYKRSKISDDLRIRIIELLLRGYTVHTVRMQIESEGIKISERTVKRILDSENKKRQELQLSLITTDKRMKGPFISNIRF